MLPTPNDVAAVVENPGINSSNFGLQHRTILLPPAPSSSSLSGRTLTTTRTLPSSCGWLREPGKDLEPGSEEIC